MLASLSGRPLKRTGVNIEFPVEVHRERAVWVASCPQLHVASQGSTADEAMAMLQEALALFLEGCRKEGILGSVLEESGLTLAYADRQAFLRSSQTPV